MNGLNKHLGADGIRLHVQCWLTHANIQHFINKAIKFAVTFRDDVELLDQAFRHFTIVIISALFNNVSKLDLQKDMYTSIRIERSHNVKLYFIILN